MNRREYIRRFLVLAFVALCAVLLVFILFYERIAPMTEVIEDVVMEADVTLRSFNYTETVDGVAHWTLTADSAAHDFTTEQSVLKNVRMRLYDQQQLGDVVLTARFGTAHLPKQLVVAEGDVVIVSGNGYRLTTNSVIYRGMDSSAGVIVANEHVNITSAQLELAGTGLTLDVAKKTMTLEQNVTAVFYPQQIERGEH